jgi:glutaminyl-tRNA synthetase
MYDWAHGQSDSIEGITHSICTLEFEDHRPLYDWFVEQLGIHHPRQIEFARLNLTYTLMSKRKLLTLVQEGIVAGWDDPRMPTISGLRRRGFTPESIRDFAERIGVAKRDSMVDYALLEHCLRDDLNRRAMRVMSVLRPLKLIIDNYPEGKVEEVEAVNNPEDPGAGTRKLPFSRELYVERDDFQETPHKKWFRLAPGSEVRLKHGYIIKCVGFEKDPNTGEVTELHATYDPATRSAPMAGAALSEAGRSGESTDGHQGPADRKVKGTLHWVSAAHAAEAEVRLYDHLFTKEAPDSDPDFRVNLNPHSLEVLRGARIEPGLKNAKPGDRFQFLRHGYFCVDTRESRPGASAVSGGPVFNRTTSLRDTWAKIEGK